MDPKFLIKKIAEIKNSKNITYPELVNELNSKNYSTVTGLKWNLANVTAFCKYHKTAIEKEMAKSNTNTPTTQHVVAQTKTDDIKSTVDKIIKVQEEFLAHYKRMIYGITQDTRLDSFQKIRVIESMTQFDT